MSLLHRAACGLLLSCAVLAGAQNAPAAAAGAAATPTPTPIAARDILMSTLYLQKAAEYQYSAMQVYRSATDQLRAALRRGTASVEQEQMGNYAKLPPAIVLDIDETVLNNAAYQGWALHRGRSFNETDFRAWVRMKAAREVPGAAAFTRAAAKMGIRVIYVSNRGCEKQSEDGRPCREKRDTMENMAALGFANARDPAAFMLLDERPDWVSDKKSRRTLIAQKYRIVMLLGDDLKDMLPAETVNAMRKDPQLAQQYEPFFGRRWFVLPNPIYGSWERSLGSIEQRYALLEVPFIDAPPPDTKGLRLATWNMEWLRSTDVTPGDRLYCATPEGKANNAYCAGPLRTPEDYAALARYAAALDADVIALQEVNGAAAAARVFDPALYDLYFSGQDWVQKTGFAVRKGRGLVVTQNPDIRELGQFEPPSLRWGTDISVRTAGGSTVRLLAVHMKSGCFDKPLTDTSTNRYGGVPCPILRAQLPVLQAWIDARRAEGVNFAVLGDFNRRLSKEAQVAKDAQGQPLNLWANIAPSAVTKNELVLAGAGEPYRKCVSNERYDAYIDYIAMNRGLAENAPAGSFSRLAYSDADVAKYKLSDHCAMSVKLDLP